MAATEKVNLAKHKQKTRARGRQPSAKVGDVESIVNMILHESDKFDVNVVNQYGKFLKMKLDMANGIGDFKKVSLKDRDKAIDFCLARAEDFLSEYFEEEVDSGVTTSVSQEVDSGVTTSVSQEVEEEEDADIITLDFKKA